jgi:hypothetical protein
MRCQINRPMDTAPRGKYVRIRYANGEHAFGMSIDGWENTGPETPLTPVAWSPIVDPDVDDLIEAMGDLIEAIGATASYNIRIQSKAEIDAVKSAVSALSKFEDPSQ